MARILIAEDEPRISSFINKGLSSNGFSVAVVEDGIRPTTTPAPGIST